MITVHKIVVVGCYISLLATPLAREVFAQQDAPLLAEPELASTSESEDATVAQVPETENWYRSDRLSGKVDQGDFVVGPGRAEISADPGETIVQIITVTNRISENRSFQLEVEDITGSSDGSSAVSLTGAARGPYSIRDFISFPEETFTLALGERARIPVTITVPPDAEPGGFYGSVLVSTIQDAGSADAAAPRAPIVARVGSLFFLTVKGETNIEGKTVDLTTLNDQWWYEKGPVEFAILYENTGSVHVNPYGELEVKNMFGERVGFVELEPWFVLPSSLRVREIEWDREFLLGRYKATARVNRGYEDVVDEVSTVFWVMPWKLVAGLFFVLFIIIFTVRAFFRTFEFKRK